MDRTQIVLNFGAGEPFLFRGQSSGEGGVIELIRRFPDTELLLVQTASKGAKPVFLKTTSNGSNSRW